MEQSDNWKRNLLLAGAVLGAATGIFAAYLMIQRSEKIAQPPQLSAGEGVKLGMSVLTMLRSIIDLGHK